jgi:hypothetical protein
MQSRRYRPRRLSIDCSQRASQARAVCRNLPLTAEMATRSLERMRLDLPVVQLLAARKIKTAKV